MNIKFKKKLLRNYLSYVDLEFEYKPGIHLVIGINNSSLTESNNGSGKTNLFTSTTWNIYEKSSKKDITNKKAKKDTLVREEFTLGKDDYVVERYHKDTMNKNKVKVFCNDQEVTQKNKTNNNNDIEDLIGITHDLWSSTIIVNQGLPINFSKLKPTARKLIIEELIGSTMWEEYRKKSTYALQECTSELTKINNEYTTISNDVAVLNKNIEYLNSLNNDNISEINEKENEILEKIKKCEYSYEKIYNNYIKLGKDNLVNNLNDNTSKLNKNQVILYQKNKIIKDKVCVTCNRPYPEDTINELSDEISKLDNENNELNKIIQNTQEGLKKAYNIEKQLNDINTIKNSLNQQLNEIRGNKVEKSDNSKMQELTNKMNERLEMLGNLNELQSDLQKEYEDLKYLDSMFLPSSHFRATVLEKYIDQINVILKDMIPMIFDNVHVMLEVESKSNSVKIDILRDGKKDKYENFSGGEQRKIDVALILSFQRFLLEYSNINSNLIVFDEIFDGLDSKGVELISECLESLFSEDTCIYVISHNNDLKTLFNSVITVVKDDNISYVEEV